MGQRGDPVEMLPRDFIDNDHWHWQSGASQSGTRLLKIHYRDLTSEDDIYARQCPRKQMEDQKNKIGKDMLRSFWEHESKLPERRRKRASKIEKDKEIKEKTNPSISQTFEPGR